ncbi:MAG: hypothetical protein JST92_00655 [Deltaproteobacteria bacterium]|nr:hypothetical protein [Deltaproteobacteria bacterium]
MSEETKKMSLNVVGQQRPPKQGEAPPSAVWMSEPMLRYRCNQKGCCCSGWEIPFTLDDLLKLNAMLPEDERAAMGKGIQLVIDAEKKGEKGEAILHSVKLDGVGDDKACRFLEGGGGCGIHRKHGIAALPDLCVDFPGFPFKRTDGAVELWFDPVCPSVIDQFAESDAPWALHRQEGAFGDPGLDVRVSHAADPIAGRVGKFRLEFDALDQLRAVCVAELGKPQPIFQSLANLLEAFKRLDPLQKNGGVFDPYPVEPTDFVRFLFEATGAHGPDLLAASFVRYKRFIHSIDPMPIVNAQETLQDHLKDWQPAFAQWLAPHDDLLRPLQARWLAHRFGAPMTKGRAELRRAADEIVHCFATSLRFAAAMGATLQRPVDRDLYKAAIGAAEYVYRSLHLPRQALPWFAAFGMPVELNDPPGSDDPTKEDWTAKPTPAPASAE